MTSDDLKIYESQRPSELIKWKSDRVKIIAEVLAELEKRRSLAALASTNAILLVPPATVSSSVSLFQSGPRTSNSVPASNYHQHSFAPRASVLSSAVQASFFGAFFTKRGQSIFFITSIYTFGSFRAKSFNWV